MLCAMWFTEPQLIYFFQWRYTVIPLFWKERDELTKAATPESENDFRHNYMWLSINIVCGMLKHCLTICGCDLSVLHTDLMEKGKKRIEKGVWGKNDCRLQCMENHRRPPAWPSLCRQSRGRCRVEDTCEQEQTKSLLFCFFFFFFVACSGYCRGS